MNLEQLKELCSDSEEVKWLIDEYRTGLKAGYKFSVLIYTSKDRWMVQHFDQFGVADGNPYFGIKIEDVSEHYF